MNSSFSGRTIPFPLTAQECDYDPLETSWVSLLRNSVFHFTDATGLKGIISTGVIRPSERNKVGPHGMPGHMCAQLGDVCLCNTHNLEDEDIRFGLEGMNIKKTPYFIFINYSIMPLIRRHETSIIKSIGTICPRIEYGYHGSIPVTMIDKCIHFVFK